MRLRRRRTFGTLLLLALLGSGLVVPSASPSAAYPRPGEIERVSALPGEPKASARPFGFAEQMSISATGRYIVYRAEYAIAGNVLFSPDRNGLYLKDRKTGDLEFVTVDSLGRPGVAPPLKQSS